MDNYNVIVIEYPAKRLVGLKVRTSMQKAAEDCPALWMTFGPRISQILSDEGGCKGSYGVSVMLNAEEFDYWAAVEMETKNAIPEGMSCIDIPAGLYAKCAVTNLETLGDTLMHIYTEWPKSQKEYIPDEQNPCFELYPANWQPTTPFEVFAPVKKA